MLISGKGKCFHGVWLHFKKFSGKYFLVFGKEEGKHTSRKTQATTQKKIINDNTEHRPTTAPSIVIRDRDRRLDLAKRQSRSQIFLSRLHTRSCDRRFARLRRQSRSRSGAISRRRDRNQRRDLATARSRSVRTGYRNRARALSLSLSFSENTLKGK